MSIWEKFKKRYLGKIGSILSWVFNIAGLFLAVLSFIKNDTDLGWAVVLTIIIFNSILIMAIAIYETHIYKKGDQIAKSFEAKFSQLSQKLDICIEQRGQLRYYYDYIIMTCNKFSTQLLAVNYKLQESISNISEISQSKLDGCLMTSDINNDYFLRLQDNAIKEYRHSMLKEFNHFLGNITAKLTYMLDMLLREKECYLNTSISVKQFNYMLTDVENINHIKIITTFRDHKTYSQKKREIGKAEYTINGNSDFQYCISHPYFLKNNIKRGDKTYSNEHEGFLEFYNCTIVAAIKCQYPMSQHIYGYLTCDILNKDYTKDNLLDDEMAELLATTATLMGIYFDNMDYQWSSFLETDFLNDIYTMKHQISTI